jgi:hypothetical protein
VGPESQGKDNYGDALRNHTGPTEQSVIGPSWNDVVPVMLTVRASTAYVRPQATVWRERRDVPMLGVDMSHAWKPHGGEDIPARAPRACTAARQMGKGGELEDGSDALV